jgi:hypothetical protein
MTVSPAMVVALAALFVSLAGNATAVTVSLVTSKQIKDNTIQVRDLAPAAGTALRGRRGPAGPPGPTGPRGSTGVTGPPTFGLPMSSPPSHRLNEGGVNAKEVG